MVAEFVTPDPGAHQGLPRRPGAARQAARDRRGEGPRGRRRRRCARRTTGSASWPPAREQLTPRVARPDEPTRIGVAIDIPEPWGAELTRRRAEAGDPLAAFVPAHLTLLGPTEVAADAAAGDRGAPGARSPASTQPFALHLRGTGTFRPVTEVVFVTRGGRDQRVRAARPRPFSELAAIEPDGPVPVPPARHRGPGLSRRSSSTRSSRIWPTSRRGSPSTGSPCSSTAPTGAGIPTATMRSTVPA